MQKRDWINYGDVHYLSEGGSMVRPAWENDELKKYPSLASEYEVLMLSHVPTEVNYPT